MNDLKPVENLVRSYFCNAVIIDDQLETEQQHPFIKLSDDDLGELDLGLTEELTGQEVAATSEQPEDYNIRPTQTFLELVKDGFVTCPYKFLPGQDVDKQIEWLAGVLSSAKLMVIDWNLENVDANSPTLPGGAAIKFIEKFISEERGLKCALIYTQEECPDVIEQLKERFEFIDPENGFFQEKDSQEGNSLFGFVISKHVSPEQIISTISKILVQDKSIVLHFIDSSNYINQNLHKTLHHFNAPFEKVIFIQILTSQLTNHQVPRFLNNILISSVLENKSSWSYVDLIFPLKKVKLKEAISEHGLNKDDVKQLAEIIKVPRKSLQWAATLCDKPDFVDKVKHLLNSEVSSLEEFFREFTTICFEFIEPQMEEKEKLKVVRNFSLLLITLDVYLENKEEFRESFTSQFHKFTKLLKYTHDPENSLTTGNIYVSKDGNGKYLLCITPFCDTFRPEEIDHTYKFLVGEPHENLETQQLKNNDVKCFYMAFPANENDLIFIKWKYYNTTCLNKDELEEGYQRLITLKREYVQNIMNRYIAYQSRAGVEELFYKESSYIDNFIDMLS